MYYLDEMTESPRSESPPVKIKTEKPVRKSKALPIQVSMAIAHRAYKGPNMSRTIHGTNLHPFPSFDKCDSLLFFPSTFSSCMNSADLPSMAKLLKYRTDKNCTFTMRGRQMDLESYLYGFEIINEMHPDSMLAVHQTKVVGNQIRASVYIKYTENRVIRNAMEKSIKDPTFLDVCPTPRPNTQDLEEYLSTKTEDEREQLIALVNSTDELRVYAKGVLTLTFDDYTRKITHFDSTCEYTSFGAAR